MNSCASSRIAVYIDLKVVHLFFDPSPTQKDYDALGLAGTRAVYPMIKSARLRQLSRQLERAELPKTWILMLLARYAANLVSRQFVHVP